MGDSVSSRAEEVRDFIVGNVNAHASDIAAFAAGHFGITRQAIHLHLQALVKKGLLVGEGKTKGKTYRRPATVVRLPTDGLSEHDLYLEHVKPLLQGLPHNVLSVCEYGVTEMVNNVIDHSGSNIVEVVASREGGDIVITIEDAGIGIFRKIQNDCGLDEPRLAVFELTKGKLTTDPERHTGEGVFFTSRMFDVFAIESRGLYLGRQRDGSDWLFSPDGTEGGSQTQGTTVRLSIRTDSSHTTQDVFDKYAAEQDDYAFSKTHVVVKLADTGEASFVSRSQAKRIVARLEEFREVMLDFDGVKEIGPAFADEIFRVFAAQHSDTNLVPIKMNEQVTKMWLRTLGRANDSA